MRLGASPHILTLPLRWGASLGFGFRFSLYIPVISVLSLACCRGPRLFVSRSAIWSCVDIYRSSTAFSLTLSLSQWY